MSTKALLTVMHDGNFIAFLHAPLDGGKAAVASAVLEALAKTDSLAGFVGKLTAPGDTPFKWTEFKPLTAKEQSTVERNLEYIVALNGEGSSLAASMIYAHDKDRPGADFTGTPTEYLKELNRIIRQEVADTAFVGGAAGKQDYLEQLATLNTGLVAPPGPARPISISAETETIVRQVASILESQGINPQSYKLRTLPDGAVRVINGSRKVDIKLDRAADLYDVQLHTTNRKLDTATKEHKGLFADQLGNMLKHLSPAPQREKSTER